MRNAAEGVVLLEAAHAVDSLAALRALSMDGKTLAEINTIQRLEICAGAGSSRPCCAQLRVSHATTTNLTHRTPRSLTSRRSCSAAGARHR